MTCEHAPESIRRGVGPASRVSSGKSCFLIVSGVLLAISQAVSQTQPWNLPYVRPAEYDYSSKYATNFGTFVKGSPTFFPTRLNAAWTFWKQNFMMSNGLVMHKRWLNNQIIGTNEAVSEGQGYGMILAVLLNDQTTFNRIFEAANTNMWDGGKKSYKWSWPGGSSGAASDADLDICLALVFADDLVKAKLWKTYSGSVSYNARAMDIMRSIKQNMTTNNYLLPGDNWAGDGVNNLNPSYFATAWFKVFNAYQTEINWTPVIDNCYAVLAKTPRYGSGQAPDWCNMNGQQASQAGGKTEQGLGMLSDGIRVPYRIGLDALWFKDTRAIAYCKNTMKTLTEYTSGTPLALAAQMAQYSKSGVSITETRGSFDNMAMWMTAMLGSGDATFMAKGTDSQVLAHLMGTSNSFLGDNGLQDDKFYYKQSIGMLGFAAIGGQFPNIQADAKVPATPILAPKSGRTGVALRMLMSGSTLGWLDPTGVSGHPAYRNALGQSIIVPN
jgi:endo-1,4-beta-D-glucanase Y